MFDRLSQHPAIICTGFLGSVASIIGLFFAFKTHNVTPSDVDPKPSAKIEDPITPDLEPAPDLELSNELPWTLVQTLAGHEHIVTSIAFEKDGQRLVSGSMDGTLRVWKVSTGVCLQSLSTNKVPYGTNASVYSVDVNPQGTLIASGHGRVFRLWDIETGNNIQSFEDAGRTYWSVAFNPDGTQLAAASSDGVQLLDLESKAKRETETEQIASVAFSPNGSLLATAGRNGTLKIWNVDALEVPRPPESTWRAFTSCWTSRRFTPLPPLNPRTKTWAKSESPSEPRVR